MASYLSNTQKNLTIGIEGYTEGTIVSDVYGDVLLSGKLGIGSAAINFPLEVDGDALIAGALRTSTGDGGSFGQVLISTGGGIDWIDIGDLGPFDPTGISIYEEGTLVGGFSTTTQLNFQGSYVTVSSISPGQATITFDSNPNFESITVQFNEVWHEGNDGPGSGMNADLLDGQHGVYYSDFDNLANKPELGDIVNVDDIGRFPGSTIVWDDALQKYVAGGLDTVGGITDGGNF